MSDARDVPQWLSIAVPYWVLDRARDRAGSRQLTVTQWVSRLVESAVADPTVADPVEERLRIIEERLDTIEPTLATFGRRATDLERRVSTGSGRTEWREEVDSRLAELGKQVRYHVHGFELDDAARRWREAIEGRLAKLENPPEGDYLAKLVDLITRLGK
jgi:hypothetical protein